MQYVSWGEFVVSYDDWSSSLTTDLGALSDAVSEALSRNPQEPTGQVTACGSCGGTGYAGAKCSWCRQLISAVQQKEASK